MDLRMLRSCVIGMALLLISGCAPLAVEDGTIVLEPTRTATYKFGENAQDFFCGLDSDAIPPTIYEEDLRPGEVGTGFRNWHRQHSAFCGRRYSWVHQGLVEFDLQPLRDIEGAVTVKSAALLFHERRLAIGDPPRPFRSVSDGLESTHCPILRRPAEQWARGWQEVVSKADLIEAEDFPSARTISLDLPDDGDRRKDVTRWVRWLLQGQPKPADLLFESTSDLRYQSNNQFCMHILGDFRLEVEYQRIVRAGE